MTHEKRYKAIVFEFNNWHAGYEKAFSVHDAGKTSLCAFMSNAILMAVMRSRDEALKAYFDRYAEV